MMLGKMAKSTNARDRADLEEGLKCAPFIKELYIINNYYTPIITFDFIYSKLEVQRMFELRVYITRTLYVLVNLHYSIRLTALLTN